MSDIPKRCYHCHKEGTDGARCDGCSLAWYCSAKCKDDDREEHKLACEKPTLKPAAEALQNDIYWDEFPAELQNQLIDLFLQVNADVAGFLASTAGPGSGIMAFSLPRLEGDMKETPIVGRTFLRALSRAGFKCGWYPGGGVYVKLERSA